MRLMPKMMVVAAPLALALVLSGAAALAQNLAQGVAPGGGIGNSTGIGSGLGGVIGTGPSYPNGTTQPTLTPPPPPGGYGGPRQAPPAVSIVRPSHYPQPREPFEATTPRPPASTTLGLPEQPTNNLSFLKGCWRSDVFQYAQHPGVTTYCFDDKGVGRLLYTRQDQPGYFCRAPAQASYVDQQLRFHGAAPACSDRNDSYPADLDCQEGSDGAQCSTTAFSPNQTVRLYRVR